MTATTARRLRDVCADTGSCASVVPQVCAEEGEGPMDQENPPLDHNAPAIVRALDEEDYKLVSSLNKLLTADARLCLLDMYKNDLALVQLT
jgi:hypothetical protein